MTDHKPITRLEGASRPDGGTLRLVRSLEAPAFPIDRHVDEEDRYLVLSAPAVLPDVAPHPIRVLTASLDAEPVPCGELRLRGERILAVIYDLDATPITNPRWIAGAYRALVAQPLSSISLPLLGAAHGRIDADESLRLLLGAIAEKASPSLTRIWIRAAG